MNEHLFQAARPITQTDIQTLVIRLSPLVLLTYLNTAVSVTRVTFTTFFLRLYV